jgi:branched-chain amino acid transport system substrate-binding protein
MAEWLIEQDVVAIVGLEDSASAIPAGDVANRSRTPMIATTATHPNVTLGQTYVFRTGFVNADQANVLVNLGSDVLKAKKASILFQEDLASSADLASEIKQYWEALHGIGSVVSYVTFNTTNINASNYQDQINNITLGASEILFLPILSQQVPTVMKALRDGGFTNPTIGGDGWGDLAALKECGDACVDSFYTSNFVADDATDGVSKNFVEKYTDRYGVEPNDMAALAYDAVQMIKVGLKKYGEWKCNIFKNRDGLRNALEKIDNFDGVAGDITFDENHNPANKCVYIARVNAAYYPTYYFSYCG